MNICLWHITKSLQIKLWLFSSLIPCASWFFVPVHLNSLLTYTSNQTVNTDRHFTLVTDFQVAFGDKPLMVCQMRNSNRVIEIAVVYIISCHFGSTTWRPWYNLTWHDKMQLRTIPAFPFGGPHVAEQIWDITTRQLGLQNSFLTMYATI